MAGTNTRTLSIAAVVALVATATLSVVVGALWPAATAVAAVAFAATAFGVATKTGWARPVVPLGVTAGAAGAVLLVDGAVWVAPVAAVGVGGWFVLRTLHKYLRDADELPGSVRARLERKVQFAGESVAGLHVAVRGDGATFLIGYAGEVRSVDVQDKAIARFAQSAAAGRDILARQGVDRVTALCVVEGDKVRAAVGDVVVASIDAAGAVLDQAEAPAFDDILAAAEAAGVQLNRETARQVRSGRGQSKAKTKGSSKVVHQGRVTRKLDS
jgi:hypothetical protein